MADNPDDLLSKPTTFRFASGQILNLNQNQIEKIPYVSALASSADWFESARDEDGNLKLDPCIKYEDFIYILNLLPFHSIRQLFTNLPKEKNVIAIIYLFDFLGLGPQPDPTLNEVDLAFFSTVSYNPLTEKHSLILQSSIIRDMAVRFAIAIVKEEYDLSKDEVINHVYWLIMFIMSAWKYFGPRLRYHVHTIAKNCFTVFKPSKLKSLMELNKRINYDRTRWFFISGEYDDGGRDPEYFDYFKETLKSDYYWQDYEYRNSGFRKSLSDLYASFATETDWWNPKIRTEQDLLEPAHNCVLEPMYGRLQDQICRRAIAILRNTQIHKDEVLPDAISNLFKNKLVQEEIRNLVLEELSTLIPKLKQKHVDLQKKLQSYELSQDTDEALDSFYSLFTRMSRFWNYEPVQRETLCYALLLDKFDHSSDIVATQVQQRVCKSLYNAALKQFNQWLKTQQEIDALRDSLTKEVNFDGLFSKWSNSSYQRYRTPAPKPMPKRQLKYSKR